MGTKKKKLKKTKASGEDNISNEAWIYGTENLIQNLWRALDEIWKGGDIPTEWMIGKIKPLHKKGNKESVNNSED